MENYITYIAGGLFGDFFNQLSVIKEKYLQTGKKGILYISNTTGDTFRFGLEKMYSNTYDIIIKQDYIEVYKIHNGEHYDINLSSWRCNRYLYHTNWYWVFSDEYSIEWGKHKWIDVGKDEKWNNKVILNQPIHRFENVDYQKLYNKYGDKLVFFAFKDTNYSDYENFVEKTGINIEYYNPIDVMDLAVAINSCELFIGSASGFMALAISLKANALFLCDINDILNGNMDKQFANINYYSNI
jgi:hypothetical protein